MLEVAKVKNLLSMLYEILMEVVGSPLGINGKSAVVSVGREVVLPSFNVFLAPARRARVGCLHVISRFGSVYVEPVLEVGVAPVAVYGRGRLYSILYGAALLAYNPWLAEAIFGGLGLRGAPKACLEVSRIVSEWFRLAPPVGEGVERLPGYIYAVEASVEGWRGESRTGVIAFIDPRRPGGYGLLIQHGGKLSELRAGDVEAETARDALRRLADVLRADIEHASRLLEKLKGVRGVRQDY